MIELTGTEMAPSPPVATERRHAGGPDFAILLAQASATPDGAPLAEPGPDPAMMAGPMPAPVPERAEMALRRVVADHAIRFDARGMIAMAAVAPVAPVAPVEAPVGAAPVARDGGGTLLSSEPRADALPVPVAGGVRPAGAGAGAGAAPVSAMPVERAVSVRSPSAPRPATGTVPGEVAPAPPPPDEPEVASSPAARPRPRLAAMAQGAPQVAVAALADGLAVSVAVGALSEGERHRLRDAIAATLSRHGLRPRAVTLLATPASTLPMER